MEKQKYSIGLDIGTTSVGWAVINPDNFEILKGKTTLREYNLQTGEVSKSRNTKKPLWGVRLFSEAESAKNRRTHRSARRRYDRRRARIKLLQDIFRDEITKKDPTFFDKLKTSFYSPLDKFHNKYYLSESDKRNIFSNNKRNRNNKEDKIYPTIYHLRKELIENPEKKDIRLVYLALHHIIKYRGNFLYQNDSFNIDNLNIQEKLKEVFELYNDLIGNINIYDDDYKKFEKALDEKNNDDFETSLKVSLESIFGNNNSKKISEMVKMLRGNQFNILKLLDLEKEENSIEKLKFKGTDYDDKEDELTIQLGDKFDVLALFKELYDMVFLKRLFRGSKEMSISGLMVEYYQKHKEDLNNLKKVLKENPKEYKKVFKNKKDKDKETICLYEKYVKNTIDFEEFRKELEKSLVGISESETLIKIKNQLENEDFLPRITSKDNGKFPYQLNKDDLRKIIENQGKYYNFLLEKVDGSYKIEKILSFKIPYYVGPLNNQTKNKNIKNSNAWLIRNSGYENTIITPYNFNEVINKEETAKEFIARMVGKCTYLNSENAMPTNSIFYSKFKLYNELKQISINGEKLDMDTINSIYHNLFLNETKVTKNKLEKFIRTHGKMIEGEIKGFQKEDEFASSMKSYIDFFGKCGIFNGTPYTIEDAEKIIEDITIFEDKDILKTRIKRDYPLLNEKIEKIIKLKYKGWSSISKKLLSEVYYMEKETNERKNIMDLMLETNENFMQILENKKYNFQKKIDKLNKIEKMDKISYELVRELKTSPSNKRGIYQALLVVDEIVKLMGTNPKSISIEMARGEEEKKRTDSRRKQLEKIYKEIETQVDEVSLTKLKNELNSCDDNMLRKKSVFLYFIQLGKCLYTGEPLDIDSLDKDCEVDHIIPRTLIPDNSLDNQALVLKTANQIKKDSFVVPEEYRKKQHQTWNMLYKMKLLSNKKYASLTRKIFLQEQIDGFINRQLVETRQISKHVANILSNFYEGTKIIYLNANLSHSYREKFKLYKFRSLNDYHHAHDAYLAAFLGIYQDNYLNKDVSFDELRELTKKYYDNKQYKELHYGFVINSLDNSIKNTNNKTQDAFDNIKYNKIVMGNLYRNDIIITKKTEFKTGEFYNETIYKKGTKGMELKKGFLPSIYGAHSSINSAYAVVVKYNDDQEENQRIIGIPIIIDKQNNEESMNQYIRETLNIKRSSIIDYIRKENDEVLKIPFNTKLIWREKNENDQDIIKICMLVGATETVEVCNAKEFKIPKSYMEKWKSTLNRILNNKTDENFDVITYEKELSDIINFIFESIQNNYNIYHSSIKKINSCIKLSKNVQEQEKLITELLKLLQYNSDTADLSTLKYETITKGEPKTKSMSTEFGRQNKKKISHASVMFQSPAGIRTKVYEF